MRAASDAPSRAASPPPAWPTAWPGDPDLRQYRALIIDEAHERSLNIDFLLGYLRNLLDRRPDLRVVISSATLDAGSFATFFGTEDNPAPVIEAPGRMFPVAEFFLPPQEDEELPQHVVRATDWLGNVEPRGDVLVFLPGEREIRECADALDGRRYPGTEVLPLFARLGLTDQQRVFHPGGKRRIILATNVAETSLTIPRIACVIDSGVARVSRWSPGRGVQRNALRKTCKSGFLNFRRVIEWANVADELTALIEREWKLKVPPLDGEFPYAAIHRSLLSGAPRQFGLWDRESKSYRSASGGFFAVFPASGLFGIPKRWEWVMAMELVETSRLWARRVARIDPEWVEQVAPHLCHSRYGEAHWDVGQGAVYGKETVTCGGLPIVAGRRVHYGRIDPATARAVFLREGLLGGGIRKRGRFLDRIDAMREEVAAVEQKLRRPGGLWGDESLLRFLEERLPADIHTAAAFHKWLAGHEDTIMPSLGDVLDEDLDSLGLEGFPDALHHAGNEYALYYRTAPGERDDGVTLGVHVDQLPGLPPWLPAWGVDGNLRERAESLIRSLPKDYRRICQPIGPLAEGFAARWSQAPKDAPLADSLAEYIRETTGAVVPADEFGMTHLPPHLVIKIWVCDDDGEELAMGEDVAVLKLQLADRMKARFEAAANANVERSGIDSWDGEALPDRVETPGGPAFPALVDEGKSAGVKAFTCEAEAREAHRAGGARLLTLAHPDPVNHLRKRYPLGMMAKVELARLGTGGTSIDDLILLAAEGIAKGPFPRSPADFQRLAGAVRGDWHSAATAVGGSIDAILDLLAPTRDWIAAHRDDRNLGGIAGDIGEQLEWLFRPRFAWRAGFARLRDYPRRLIAIRSRLGRISSLPIVKDLEKMERFRKLWEPWFRNWTAEPEDPRLWETGWMLEEFRVSLFAPDVPTQGKVSEKAIGQMAGIR